MYILWVIKYCIYNLCKEHTHTHTHTHAHTHTHTLILAGDVIERKW